MVRCKLRMLRKEIARMKFDVENALRENFVVTSKITQQKLVEVANEL